MDGGDHPVRRGNVVVVLPSLTPGGAERTLVNIANGLAGSTTVHVAVVNKAGGLLALIDKDVRVVDLHGRLRWLVTLPWFIRRLRNVCILSTMWDISIVLAVMKRMGVLRARLVLREAVMASHLFREPSMVPQRLLIRMYGWAARTSDGIIAMSSAMRASLCECFGIEERRVTVIGNAVREGRVPSIGEIRKKRDAAPGEGLILGVGRLEAQKGFDVLVEAFALLYREFPGTRMAILGEGTERKSLERRVRELGLEAVVSLPGHVSDIVPYMGKARIFALTSRFEGVSNAMLEALCSGVPVVAVKEGTSAEEFIRDGENGMLVPECEKEKLYFALGEVLRSIGSFDPVSIAEDARRRFSPEEQIEQYRKLLGLVSGGV